MRVRRVAGWAPGAVGICSAMRGSSCCEVAFNATTHLPPSARHKFSLALHLRAPDSVASTAENASRRRLRATGYAYVERSVVLNDAGVAPPLQREPQRLLEPVAHR